MLNRKGNVVSSRLISELSDMRSFVTTCPASFYYDHVSKKDFPDLERREGEPSPGWHSGTLLILVESPNLSAASRPASERSGSLLRR